MADDLTAQLREAAATRFLDNPIALGWAGPTILHAGTDAQKRRYLPPIVTGEETWCQLFSEPEAGSDLASLRTRADRDGEVYVVNGQKVWTTWADTAAFGILLARTEAGGPAHKGISYFICPMDLPGIEVRPIREMTGGFHFNEVFLTDVRIASENLVGAEGDGWRLAVMTLGNERDALSTGGLCWGMGPTTEDFLERVRAGGGVGDPVLRQRVASAFVDQAVLQPLDPSMRKLAADVHGQRVTELAKDLDGATAMLDPADEWHWAFLFARALTIGGGTTEVQRNIIGERLLGLPREPR